MLVSSGDSVPKFLGSVWQAGLGLILSSFLINNLIQVSSVSEIAFRIKVTRITVLIWQI